MQVALLKEFLFFDFYYCQTLQNISKFLMFPKGTHTDKPTDDVNDSARKWV